MLFLFIRNYSCPLVVAGDEALLHVFDPKAEILLRREIEECYLDPGGMLCTQTPILSFTVDGFSFAIKADQIERMLELWESAKIRAGYVIVSMWMRQLLLPIGMYHKLHDCLEKAHSSDIALNAELTRSELLMKLYEKGVVLEPPELS